MLEVLLCIVLVEIAFLIFSNYIRSRNQWFITAKDNKLLFDKQTLEKVLTKSYDPLLGWDRKPNTSGIDEGRNSTTRWSINQNGARNNLEYNNQKSFISLFGDSFTFSREVNDDETFAYQLSCLTKTNVENFGVGNFGFDQALLKLTNKLESKYFRPKIVVIGVVPDTISRILSVWKHYYEYGNIYGFKPRYILKNGTIRLINNYINTQDKFYEIEKYIRQIQRNDFFYKNKFSKEVIDFPYTVGFLKNLKRNLSLSYETLKKGYIRVPTASIMKNNLNYRIRLYKEKQNVDLLVEELKLFEMLAHKYNFKACFVIIPQKDDINYIKKNNYHFYQNLIDNVPAVINCIDIYKYFKEYSKEELDSLYIENTEYGGHLNNRGNSIIAKILDEKINNNDN